MKTFQIKKSTLPTQNLSLLWIPIPNNVAVPPLPKSSYNDINKGIFQICILSNKIKKRRKYVSQNQKIRFLSPTYFGLIPKLALTLELSTKFFSQKPYSKLLEIWFKTKRLSAKSTRFLWCKHWMDATATPRFDLRFHVQNSQSRNSEPSFTLYSLGMTGMTPATPSLAFSL